MADTAMGCDSFISCPQSSAPGGCSFLNRNRRTGELLTEDQEGNVEFLW